jgi:predicted TIM-barrel enzyme
VGSGVTPESVGAILDIADGVIVASALKEDGVWWNAVDEARVRGFMAAVSRAPTG